MNLSEEDKDRLIEILDTFSEFLSEIYINTIGVLEEGITVGNTDIPIGIQSLGMFADLLHGGAYLTPVTELPYYQPSVQRQIQFQSNVTQSGIVQFFLKEPVIITLPDGKQIALPTGAKPEQVEIIVNSAGGAKHRFPKLLSDQQFYLVKEWLSLFNTVDLVQRSTTAVTTLVQGGKGAQRRATSPTAKKIMGLIEATRKKG